MCCNKEAQAGVKSSRGHSYLCFFDLSRVVQW